MRRTTGALAVAGLVLACGSEPALDTAYADDDTTSTVPSVTTVRFTRLGAGSAPAFEHVTGAFGEKWMPETMGGGVALIDHDGDGWSDLAFTSGTAWPGRAEGRGTPGVRLFHNNAGTAFREITNEAGLAVSFYGMGLAVADYDADGDDDLYVTAVGDNHLFRNDRGRFTDVTIPMGVHGNDPSGLSPPAWSTGAAWVDVDRDGWLDLFVCNYVRWTPATDLFATLDGTTKSYATPQQYEGESCRLYANRGGRAFEDVTLPAGLNNPNGKSLSVAVEDINNDGWMDLVVANDTFRNFLYLNDGDGTFTEIGLQAGVALDEFGRARAGMGIDIADVMGRGQLSIVIGNFSREAVSLYTLVGESVFQDMAGRAGLNRPTTLPLTFGVQFADLDLDGDADLLAANGHIEPEINAVQQDVTFRQAPQLFLNDGAGRFGEVGAEVGGGFQEPLIGRGVAVGDLDRDGDLDVVITSNGEAPAVWRNDAGGSAVQLVLQGAHPNLGAVGALVMAYAGDTRQRWMVRTGSSYLSQSDYRRVIFGLGTLPGFDSVTVRWPTTGRVTNLGPLGAGAYTVQETSDSAVPRGAQR